MTTKIRIIATICFGLLLGLNGCKKDTYSFGQIKTPSTLTVTTVIKGVDASNPNGDGSGNVTITATATDALSYKIDYGDGTAEIVNSGIVTHKYNNSVTGVYPYTITVNAIGTGGATSTLSKTISVYTVFVLPPDILQNLTNGSSRVWITDKDAAGHVGVGPTNSFFPDYYAAGPGTRDACLYDDEITFSKDATDRVFMNVDNKGTSSLIGAATAYYGFSGGDGCYALATLGAKQLAFATASSGSTAAQSTGIQFTVPGKGIVNFGTGATAYEILALSPTNMWLRNIGIDGLAWYQKLKVK